MVLLLLHGLPPAQIAELLDCPPATVRRWISRFNREGAAGRVWGALKNYQVKPTLGLSLRPSGSKSQQNIQRLGFDLLYTRAVLVKQPEPASPAPA